MITCAWRDLALAVCRKQARARSARRDFLDSDGAMAASSFIDSESLVELDHSKDTAVQIKHVFHAAWVYASQHLQLIDRILELINDDWSKLSATQQSELFKLTQGPGGGILLGAEVVDRELTVFVKRFQEDVEAA